jgi:hypothetical protein
MFPRWPGYTVTDAGCGSTQLGADDRQVDGQTDGGAD